MAEVFKSSHEHLIDIRLKDTVGRQIDTVFTNTKQQITGFIGGLVDNIAQTGGSVAAKLIDHLQKVAREGTQHLRVAVGTASDIFRGLVGKTAKQAPEFVWNRPANEVAEPIFRPGRNLGLPSDKLFGGIPTNPQMPGKDDSFGEYSRRIMRVLLFDLSPVALLKLAKLVTGKALGPAEAKKLGEVKGSAELAEETKHTRWFSRLGDKILTAFSGPFQQFGFKAMFSRALGPVLDYLMAVITPLFVPLRIFLIEFIAKGLMPLMAVIVPRLSMLFLHLSQKIMPLVEEGGKRMTVWLNKLFDTFEKEGLPKIINFAKSVWELIKGLAFIIPHIVSFVKAMWEWRYVAIGLIAIFGGWKLGMLGIIAACIEGNSIIAAFIGIILGLRVVGAIAIGFIQLKAALATLAISKTASEMSVLANASQAAGLPVKALTTTLIGKMGLVAAAGAAGYAIGSWVDQMFNISGRIAGWWSRHYGVQITAESGEKTKLARHALEAKEGRGSVEVAGRNPIDAIILPEVAAMLSGKQAPRLTVLPAVGKMLNQQGAEVKVVSEVKQGQQITGPDLVASAERSTPTTDNTGKTSNSILSALLGISTRARDENSQLLSKLIRLNQTRSGIADTVLRFEVA